jgi:hypothetical protein
LKVILKKKTNNRLFGFGNPNYKYNKNTIVYNNYLKMSWVQNLEIHTKSQKKIAKKNKGGSYKFKIAAKYKKPKTRGDKTFNKKNKK